MDSSTISTPSDIPNAEQNQRPMQEAQKHTETLGYDFSEDATVVMTDIPPKKNQIRQ